MIRNIAKLFAVTIALTAFLPVAPLFAAPVVWVSSIGGSDGNQCTATSPCATISGALGVVDNEGQINCLNSPLTTGSLGDAGANVTIECAGVWVNPSGTIALSLNGNQIVKIRNLTFSGATGGLSAIKVIGRGTLIIENCVFENLTGTAIDIEPTSSPFNLVIKNSRVSNNTGGVLIKPNMGASVTATFDGVTIVNNTGGLRTDSTNGAVKVDVANSSISYNTANGIVAIGGVGGNNMVTLKNDVIASNGQVGIDVSGTTAAVLVNNSVLDSNTTGATSAVSGGRILTYGNNSIIGPTGFGFTSSIPLQ
jgi:Right handed beta helix region